MFKTGSNSSYPALTSAKSLNNLSFRSPLHHYFLYIEHAVRDLLSKSIALVILCSCTSFCSSNAAVVSFSGRAPINYGSSIPGILKHDVFYFDLSIDDSVLDSDNSAHVNGFGGITAYGIFYNAITNFRLYSSPWNLGTYDPQDVTYDYSRSFFTTIDAGPGVANTNYLESIKLFIDVSSDSLSAGAPFRYLVLNLYNGTLYDPPASRQIWIDQSGSGDPTSFADFFLHGTKSLEEFRGSVPASASNASDGIFLEGLHGSGQFASGEGVSMSAVPEPTSATIYGIGILATSLWLRRKSACTRVDVDDSSPVDN
ncbi:MAG: hypothetical protein ACKN85_15265 [Pirellula sp.]